MNKNLLSTNLYWNKYNISKNKLTKKIINFNRKYSYNFLEKEHFNHTRDIIALSLVTLKKNKKKINVLDYGSNLLTLSNFKNKINVKDFKFFIYDPFYTQKIKKIKIKELNYEITNKIKTVHRKSYDIINFASSIQYQNNFLIDLEKFNFSKTKKIVITYTPFSLGKSYLSKQSNHLNLTQKVFSLKKIISKFKKLGFKLIFKSRNQNKFIACKSINQIQNFIIKYSFF